MLLINTNEANALILAFTAPDQALYGRGQPIGRRVAASLEEQGLAVRGDDRRLVLTKAGTARARTIKARRATVIVQAMAGARYGELTKGRPKCHRMASKVGTPKVIYETAAVAQLAKAVARIAHPHDGYQVVPCSRHWHLRTRKLTRRAESRRRKLLRRFGPYGCLFPYVTPTRP